MRKVSSAEKNARASLYSKRRLTLRDFLFIFVHFVRCRCSIHMINAICMLNPIDLHTDFIVCFRMRLNEFSMGIFGVESFDFRSSHILIFCLSLFFLQHTHSNCHSHSTYQIQPWLTGTLFIVSYTFLFKNSIYGFISIWYACECELIASMLVWAHRWNFIRFNTFHFDFVLFLLFFMFFFFCFSGRSVSIRKEFLLRFDAACWHHHQHSLAFTSLLSLLHRPIAPTEPLSDDKLFVRFSFSFFFFFFSSISMSSAPMWMPIDEYVVDTYFCA